MADKNANLVVINPADVTPSDLSTRAAIDRFARRTVGGLSAPSKMPWYSYSISARRCHTGSKLAEVPGSTCFGCYALKGRYNCSNVIDAMERRYQAMQSPLWADDMATVLNAYAAFDGFTPDHPAHFRWHDSGDLQSVKHLADIAKVARQTPSVRHWLPTRERGIVAKYLQLGGTIPENLVIRISATMVDAPAKTGAALAVFPTSTVHKDFAPAGNVCPAPGQGGRCGDCRACWSRTVDNVSYHIH